MNGTSFARICRNYCEESRGHVAIMAALLIVPLLTVAGFAIDYQLVTTKKTQVQFALDSAVIAGARARQNGDTEAEITQTIQTYIQALSSAEGSSMNCDSATVSFSQETQDIDASVTCSQLTTLSTVFGKTHLDFRVSSASTYGIGRLDVAFVFDSSGSMGGTRLTALKDAAALAVEELMPDGANPNNDVRIAMTAYNHMVNAGTYMPQVIESMTTTGVVDAYWSTWDQGPDCWYWGWYQGTQYWRCEVIGEYEVEHTCVYEREGAQAFTAAVPGSNAWLIATGQWEDQCPPSAPLALTADKPALLDYIDNLSANGGTAGHQGVAWGWYLLAPEWSSLWPATASPLAYDEPDSAKALILMTDGAFNSFNASGQGSSTDQARDLCDNIKTTGVVIYSVAFQAPASGEAILEYCSSGPEFFFDPTTGAQLEDSYRAIAASISDLRIAR